jgi:hypothetical protein
MKFFSRISVSSFLLLLLCGCMSFEYTGQDFPPLQSGKLPIYFKNQKLIPAGRYTIIGKAVVKTGIKADLEDVQDLLLEEAAVRGADAVCMISVQTVTGSQEEETYFSGPNSGWGNRYNLTPDGAPIQTNLDGQQIDYLPGDSGSSVKRLIVKALFLKDSQTVEKLRAAQKKELNKLTGSPAIKESKSSSTQK